MLYNSQVPRGRPSLLCDHTNVILRVVVKEGFYCTWFSSWKSCTVDDPSCLGVFVFSSDSAASVNSVE